MKSCKFIAYGLLLTASCLLFALPVSAQPTTSAPAPESLRLPEVVITGIDRSKIQRLIPKIAPPSSLPLVIQSSWEVSEVLVREGDAGSVMRPKEAEERYLKAIEIDPTNGAAYLRLGDLDRLLGKFVEAAEAYQKAIERAQEIPEAHYQLGILYESQLQNRSQAIEHYRTYLRLGGLDTRVNIWLRDLERR